MNVVSRIQPRMLGSSLTLGLLVCLLPSVWGAETAVQAWVQRYDGGGLDQATGMVVDGSDNVIVTGYSYGTGGSYDYATIRYSSAGVPLWTNRYDGSRSDYAMAMVVDGSNNVIVTGYSLGSGGAYDYATIKYSSAGVALWTNLYNGAANSDDQARAVAVDGNNDVIVTGHTSPGYWDYATIKYSSAGVPLWTNLYNGATNSDDQARAVAVDGSNNVIVTGYSWVSGGLGVYLTLKYSSAGVPLWTNRYHGPANFSDFANAVAVDGGNNVVVTGNSSGVGSAADYATIKYSSAGVPLWTNRYNGPGNLGDYAKAVVVDGSNNVIVTGYSPGSGSKDDFSTIKYSSAGVPLWTNRYNGSANHVDVVDAVAVDRRGNVIVAGQASSTGGYLDYVTLKYSGAGVPLWSKSSSGPSANDEYHAAVAVDSNGNVIVTGRSLNDFITVKYICLPSPLLSGNVTNGAFQMRIDDVLQPGTLVIEASTNLAGWSPVFTNTVRTNVVFYAEPDTTNLPWRFYRVFQFP